MVSGGRADCGWIWKEKSKNVRLWCAGKTVGRKLNGVERGRTPDRYTKTRAKM